MEDAELAVKGLSDKIATGRGDTLGLAIARFARSSRFSHECSPIITNHSGSLARTAAIHDAAHNAAHRRLA